MNRSALWLAAAAVAGCARSGPPAAIPAPPTGYDVVIEGGRIVDGSGNAWFYGDLGIRGDRIARVAPRGLLRGEVARERIDARGLVVAPGFIDIQGHSRGSFLTGDGRVVSKVTQGITTEILGEGSTDAPMNAELLAGIRDTLYLAIARTFTGEHGFDNWLRAMQEHGTSANFGSFLGASTVREYAKGMRIGQASPAELDSMRKVTRWAMENGAFGLASALIYPPGNFASTEELIEIARAMAPYGGVYITHMRSEADQLLEAIDEAIRIGREGGVPVEIYHLKAAGKRNWHKAPLAIAKIDSARAAGLDVQADMYPYVAGGTGLASCLPPWASEGGKLFANLSDPAMRARFKAEVEKQTTSWENLCDLATPEGVLLVGFRKEPSRRWVGKRLSEVAAGMGKDWIETIMDLVLADSSRIETLFFLMSEDNVKLQLQQPWIKFGTDAGGLDPDSARQMAHPRAYGTFPRILGRYVRDERVIALEGAVRKASSAVAERLSLQGRGLLKEGFFADVVVFDPATIIDRATFEQPHQLSTGVRHVFVNGTAVVRDGAHTGAKPGRAVRGPGWRGRVLPELPQQPGRGRRR